MLESEVTIAQFVGLQYMLPEIWNLGLTQMYNLQPDKLTVTDKDP